MGKSNVKHSRSQMLFSGIMVPFIVIIWMIGWILVVIGSERTLTVSSIEQMLDSSKVKKTVKSESS